MKEKKKFLEMWVYTEVGRSRHDRLYFKARHNCQRSYLDRKMKIEDDLCTHSQDDYLFEAVRECSIHNKFMELHTEIKFSKPAHPRCDAYTYIVVQSFSKKGGENTRGGWRETGPHLFSPPPPFPERAS